MPKYYQENCLNSWTPRVPEPEGEMRHCAHFAFEEASGKSSLPVVTEAGKTKQLCLS